MSTPDPNSAVTAAVSRPLTSTASVEATVTPANTIRSPPSQAPPAPPPPPQRALAPLLLHHPQQPHHPYQQAHHLYAQSFPIRRPNSVSNLPHQQQQQHQHQDPSSTLIYPFANSSRGFPTRPGRPNSPSVVEPPVTSAYHPRAVFAYQQRQLGSTAHLDPVLQFMRSTHAQLHQIPHLGSGHPVGSGPMRGIPHFLQPRVAPPPSTFMDNSEHKNARSRDDAFVIVRDRKVRITDGASLYSLCRSWLRNGLQESIQLQSGETLKSLPKPLPVHVMETSLPKDQAEEPLNEDKEDDEPVKELSEKELLKRHVNQAKKIRTRLRQERLRRIERYKARLGLLLPSNSEQSRSD